MTPVGVFFICQNEDKCHFVNSTKLTRCEADKLELIYFVCKSSRKKIPSVRLINISLSLIT